MRVTYFVASSGHPPIVDHHSGTLPALLSLFSTLRMFLLLDLHPPRLSLPLSLRPGSTPATRSSCLSSCLRRRGSASTLTSAASTGTATSPRCTSQACASTCSRAGAPRLAGSRTTWLVGWLWGLVRWPWVAGCRNRFQWGEREYWLSAHVTIEAVQQDLK